jgi:methylaspartate mutase epsilon subunit
MIIEAYRLLIGSIGDDSHSVGMALLEIMFKEAGFYVQNIGILNRMEDFFRYAGDFDAILISCMNGHSKLYIDEFPFHLKTFTQLNNEPKVWCLGGNLSVQDDIEMTVKKYRGMGFDIVSPKPISEALVMELILKKFYEKSIKRKRLKSINNEKQFKISSIEEVNDDPLTDREFLSMRDEVLDTWPTGKEVRSADIMKNHMNPRKNLNHLIMNRLFSYSGPILQPRTGVAHTSDEIEILQFLRTANLEVSSIQLDAASRKKMYHKAEEGVLKSEKGKISLLNGYPVPIHGVKGIEKILNAIDTPFQIRAGSPDHRFVYEIGLAGGTSSLEGGFLCYLYPYDKYTSPVQSLLYWKYVDKLTEWYYRNFQVVINREFFGPLTCCLIEPAIPISINIIQALLSAGSGVRCISVGLAEQGNRWQDIAAVRTLDMMTRHYLGKYGFTDCTISTVFHQYMAAFPVDREKSRDLILNSSVTGALSKAVRIMTKTPVESIHIPGREDNAEGLKLTQRGVRAAVDTPMDMEKVAGEMKLLKREVETIMKSVETLGNGSIARGAIKAFELGILDIPFSPSIYNKNTSITARDCDGAIRFVNPEQFSFSEDIIHFHKEKIHQRMVKERSTKIHEILNQDLMRIWKGEYLKWPLNGHYIY